MSTEACLGRNHKFKLQSLPKICSGLVAVCCAIMDEVTKAIKTGMLVEIRCGHDAVLTVESTNEFTGKFKNLILDLRNFDTIRIRWFMSQ